MEFLKEAMHVILTCNLVFAILGAKINEKLVFEVFTGGPSTAYSLFMDTAIAKGNNITKEHFKDCFINNWEEYRIKTVTIDIMKDNSVQAYIVFNGTQTNKTSWMTQSRIIRSTYTDIKTAETNYFSVEGYSHRHFYINNKWDGCPNDMGWLIVIEGFGECEWEKLVNVNQTLVLYSKVNTFSKYNKDGVADSMRITVTYEADECIRYSIDNQANMTIEELEREVQKLKKQLQVPKQQTSSYIRKRTSAKDDRPSSMICGIVAGVVITFVIGTPVFIDGISLLQYCAGKRPKKSKISPKSTD